MTGKSPAAAWRTEFGRWGEELAARHLTERGLVVLSRNWSCREGELDLVLTDRRQVVFCEVKTRSGTEYGMPGETVTPAKARKIRRAAEQWLREFRLGWCATRYDVVTVFAKRGGTQSVRHIEGAF